MSISSIRITACVIATFVAISALFLSAKPAFTKCANPYQGLGPLVLESQTVNGLPVTDTTSYGSFEVTITGTAPDEINLTASRGADFYAIRLIRQ